MAIPHLGELAALGTALCWTSTSLAFESAGLRIGSIAVNLIRLVLALGLLALWTGLTRGLWFPSDASAHTWGWLALSGLVGFTLGDMLLFEAFVRVGARVSMLIMSLVPPLTALAGWLILGERLGPRDALGMTLTVAGVAWVILERRRDGLGAPRRLPLSGLLLAFGGAAGQAVGLVLSKLGMGDYDAFAATHIRVIAGLAGLAVVYLFAGWWPRTLAALGNAPAMRRTALGAVFGPFLGVSLSLLAVQHTQAGVAATLMALVPVLIIPPAVLLKREKVTPRAVLGSAVAVAGSALLFLG